MLFFFNIYSIKLKQIFDEFMGNRPDGGAENKNRKPKQKLHFKNKNLSSQKYRVVPGPSA